MVRLHFQLIKKKGGGLGEDMIFSNRKNKTNGK